MKKVLIAVPLIVVLVGCSTLWPVKGVEEATEEAYENGYRIGERAGEAVVVEGINKLTELRTLTARVSRDMARIARGVADASLEHNARVSLVSSRLHNLLSEDLWDRVRVTWIESNCQGDEICETTRARFVLGIAEGLYAVELIYREGV